MRRFIQFTLIFPFKTVIFRPTECWLWAHGASVFPETNAIPNRQAHRIVQHFSNWLL